MGANVLQLRCVDLEREGIENGERIVRESIEKKSESGGGGERTGVEELSAAAGCIESGD